MAVKNARSGNKNRVGGAATAAAAAESESESAELQRLIDGDSGDGVGEGNGESGSNRKDVSASERDSGASGTLSADSGGTSDNRSSAGEEAGTRRNRSRSSRIGERAETEKETRDGSGVSTRSIAPKKVKAEIETETFKLSDSAKELIGDFYSVVFWMIGQATAVPEWQLQDEDAEVLGDRTEKFVRSLGKRRATNLMKSLGKIGPTLGFAGALAMVTVPRIKLTVARAKNPDAKPLQATTKTPTGSGGDVSITDDSSSAPTGIGTNGAAGLSERSFTADDFREVVSGFGNEDTGTIIN